jgi:hypothetical protein
LSAEIIYQFVTTDIFHLQKMLKMKILIVSVMITTMVISTLTIANAQENSGSTIDEKEVADVIKKLFKAMQFSDSAMARSAFTNTVTTATIFRDQQNKVVLKQENSIADFMKAIGTPHNGVWYEEIWDLEIRIDGDLAQTWCDYAFYIDNKFSHCGADAFHLSRTEDGWKIFHLSDTRRKAGCEVPKEIAEKHK